MKGGYVPRHFMISLDYDEGVRLRDLLRELREVDHGDKDYRMNLNEAEDELVESLVEGLASPKD